MVVKCICARRAVGLSNENCQMESSGNWSACGNAMVRKHSMSWAAEPMRNGSWKKDNHEV